MVLIFESHSTTSSVPSFLQTVNLGSIFSWITWSFGSTTRKMRKIIKSPKVSKTLEWYIFYKVSELAIPYLIYQKLSIFVDYSIRWVHYIPPFLDCWIKDKNSTCKPCPGCAVQLLRTEFTSLLKPSKSPRNKVSRNFRRRFLISW